MRYTMTDKNAPWDGEWHPISIPLSSFTEHGSWDNNTWYNPVGAFDWGAIDRFEIVAEHSSMYGIEFDFDNIRVTDSPLSVISKVRNNEDADLIRIYPNPAFLDMNIVYKVEERGRVEISILNITGQKIGTLINEEKEAGEYSLNLNIKDVNGISLFTGIYCCRIVQAGRVQMRNIIITGD
jgi:hypothetical protein